ncbi:response regulator [Tardiphaga sp. 709]|uniref:response regulator n=1 Tax=Tardiphaga sp. 709 TaxID=3076039 RepID=UPI0028E339E3|nr:response regulator [Tardiphaga sp. 709]WNV12753.1 response regulator [Tardiphaga sp. 709]
MPKRKPVIAVIDDDPRVIESLEDLLESAGYAVRCFSSAELFLASDLLELDLLITDVGLPNVDGLQLRSVVMQRHPRLPVFLITGRHEIADQARAKNITGLFRKPFDGSELLSAVGDAVGIQKAEGRDDD